MMKFFRKYTKTLLAVFMALLLVVWLGGSALTNMLQPSADISDELVGEMYGQDVFVLDQQVAVTKIRILQGLNIPWNRPWIYAALSMSMGNQQAAFQMAGRIRQEPLSELEWLMLERAAVRDGVEIPEPAVERQLTSIDPQLINQLREQRNVSLGQIRLALRSHLRVMESMLTASKAIKPTEADVRHFVRQTNEEVQLDLVTLQVSDFVDEAYEPSEEEIQAHFEEYKNEPPPGRPGMAFGYQEPEKVKAEYIHIDATELVDRQQVSDTEAMEYWSENKDQFRPPRPQPASPSDRPETPEPYETFTEAKSQVLRKIKEQRASEHAVRIARELIRQLERPWQDAPATQPHDFKTPPETVTSDDVYPNLIEGMGPEYENVLKYGQTELVDREALRQDATVGRSNVFANTPQRVPFVDAAFAVAGLEAAEEQSERLARLLRNVWRTAAEPASDFRGNTFVFRTVAAEPRHAPASVDVVREQVVADLRAKRAYEKAEAAARELAKAAEGTGLKAAYEQSGDLKKKLGEDAFRELRPFARQMMLGFGGTPQLYPASPPHVGRDAEFVEKAFDLANQTTTQPVVVGTHAQPDNRRWFVFQPQEILPVNEEEYDENRMMGLAFAMIGHRMHLLETWFAPEEIRDRVQWVERIEEDLDGEEDQEQATQTEAAL